MPRVFERLDGSGEQPEMANEKPADVVTDVVVAVEGVDKMLMADEDDFGFEAVMVAVGADSVESAGRG